ncbi:MAG: non-ribosomal peptide synthetase [Microbacterium sp.]|nr:non-ribosomal peptide synthetase [Microbacterium sp.]
MSNAVLPRPAQIAGRVFAWVLVGLILTILLAAVWVGARGALAYQHLLRVQAEVGAGASALASDPASAVPAIARLAMEASDARQLTSDPIWNAAESIPWVGPQLAAFGTVSASADELLSGAILPLATAAKDVSFDALRPVGGRIDASSLANLAEPASDAETRAREAAHNVEGIDRTPLVGIAASAVDKTGELLDQSATAIDTLAGASRLLPEMLGQDGERNYLLLVQNNAEWRSLGGIAGTAILLHTDQGGVSLLDTQSAGAIVRDLREPVTTLPDEVVDIYGTRPGRYFHNLTQIPDFSIDGPLAREMYRTKTGLNVDGVIAIDPVLLSYVLEATGPVTLPSGEQLNAGNAARILMNEVYFRYSDPSAQDAFFAAASGSVFQALLDGRGSAPSLISALYRAGEQHRLLMWSADPADQAIIADSTVAGPLPVTDDRTARFGVYLNDGTGSKMSYYVKPEVAIEWGSCQPPATTGQRSLTLSLTLTNDAPSDAATSLPTYITGEGAYGTAPGTAKVVGNLYLPEGFELVSSAVSNGANFDDATFQGRRVLTFGVDLTPQASSRITVEVRAMTKATEAEAYITPTADSALDPIVRTSCDPPRSGSATLG